MSKHYAKKMPRVQHENSEIAVNPCTLVGNSVRAARKAHIPFSKYGKTFAHQSVAQALPPVQSSDERNSGKTTTFACCSVDSCSGRSLDRAVGERPYFTSQTSPPRSSLFKSPGPFCWIIWFTCSFTTSSYRGRSSHARNSPMGVGKPGRPSMCESRNA